MGWFNIGLDLGQAQDYTAVAIVERVDAGNWLGGKSREFHLRHLERFPLGTSYPAITQEMATMVGKPPLRGASNVIADATGVGRPVIDLLRQARVPCQPVTITAGNKEQLDKETGYWYLPKRDLVSNLQVLLQNGSLKVAAELPDVNGWVDEMLNFQVKISDSGRDTYGQWREGAHDDMVLAVALACWGATHGLGAMSALPLSINARYGPSVSMR